MSDEIKNRTVYMLCRKDKPEGGTDIYIGSTGRPLEERLREHKKNTRCLKKKNYRLYIRMGEVGLQNWKIIPLLTFACNKKTIFEFEKQWIDLIGADLNTISPITDRRGYKAEYHQNNRDDILKRRAEYRMVNRDMLLKKDKEYRENNVQNKVHHCGVCDKSFGYRKDLNKHFGSLKHSYAYMNSVD